MQSESLVEEGETNSKNPSPAYISALLLELLPCSGTCISVPLNDIANCAELVGGGGGINGRMRMQFVRFWQDVASQ